MEFKLLQPNEDTYGINSNILYLIQYFKDTTLRIETTESIIVTLVKQPAFSAIVLSTYLHFIYKSGPLWMAHRKPFELRRFMLVYNAVQVLYNGAIFLFVRRRSCSNTVINVFTHILYKYLWSSFSPQCLRMIRTQNAWLSCPKSDRNTRDILLVTLLNKYLDLVDTLIIVLRKKTGQISYLHVHHHCAVVLWTTLTMHYSDGSRYSAGKCFRVAHRCEYWLRIAFSISMPCRRGSGSCDYEQCAGARFHVRVLLCIDLLSIVAWKVCTLEEAADAIANGKRLLWPVECCVLCQMCCMPHAIFLQLQFVFNAAFAMREIIAVCPQPTTLWISIGNLCQNVYLFYLFGVLYASTYRMKSRVWY